MGGREDTSLIPKDAVRPSLIPHMVCCHGNASRGTAWSNFSPFLTLLANYEQIHTLGVMEKWEGEGGNLMRLL